MEPDDTIHAIRRKETHTASDVDRLRQSTEQFPDDAYLWNILGDVAQVAGDLTLGDDFALECYRRAIRADPDYGPAHNSLGHWYDIAENFTLAKRHFELAIRNGAGDVAHVGLSRVLAQMGHDADALAELNRCAEQSAAVVLETRCEIADGFYRPYTDEDAACEIGG